MRASDLGRVLAAAMGLWALGCRGSIEKIVRPPSAPLSVTSVFVYPVAFTGRPEPAWRSFELAQRIIDVALVEAGSALELYGPSEFRILRRDRDSENAWVATNALPILHEAGSRADQGVVLRSFAERRVGSSLREALDAKGRSKGQASDEETTWVVRLEVEHPSSRVVLVEASGQVTVDPFAPAPAESEFDPAPALTRLVEQLAKEVIREVSAHAAVRTGSPAEGLAVAPTVAHTMEWEDDRPRASLLLGGMDLLEAELFVQSRVRFLAPALTDVQVGRLAKAPKGLAVLQAAPGSKLRVGDLVEAVDDRPALPQTLARARLRSVPVQLKVRRADGTAAVVVFP